MKSISSPIFLLLLLGASQAYASDEKAKPKLECEIDLGSCFVVNEKNEFNYINLDEKSKKLNGFIPYIKPNIKVSYNTSDGDIEYGASIKLDVDTAGNKNNTVSIKNKNAVYLKSASFGKIMAGNSSGFKDDMKLDAASQLACATGGIDGDAFDFIRNKALCNVAGLDHKVDISEAFVNGVSTVVYSNSKSLKLSYTSPSYHGITAALMYIPDTDVKGNISSQIEEKAENLVNYKTGNGYINGIAAGIGFKKDDVAVPFSLLVTAEYADPKEIMVKEDGKDPTWFVQRNSNLAYSLGSTAKVHNNLTLGASFTYLGDSGTIKKVEYLANATGTRDDKSTEYDVRSDSNANYFWTLGAKFQCNEQICLSATYMQSSASGIPVTFSHAGTNGNLLLKKDENLGNNNFRAIALGIDYNITKDISLYLEGVSISYYKDKDVKKNDNVHLSNPIVVLAGLKLKF